MKTRKNGKAVGVHVLCIAMVLLAAAVGISVLKDSPQKGSDKPALNEVVYEYYGTLGLFKPGIHVVVTAVDPVELYKTGDWAAMNGYWEMLKGHVADKASVKDFISILISRGDFPTGGYEIEITSLNVEDNTLRLSANFTDPGEGIMVTEAFTNPTALILVGRLPRGEYTVRLHVDLFILEMVEGKIVRVPILTFAEVVWTATFTVAE